MISKLQYGYIACLMLFWAACTKQADPVPNAYLAIANVYSNSNFTYFYKGSDSVIHYSNGTNAPSIVYDSVPAGKCRLYTINNKTKALIYDTVISLGASSYTTAFFQSGTKNLLITDANMTNIGIGYSKIRLIVTATDAENAKINLTLMGSPLIHTFSSRYYKDYLKQPTYNQFTGIPNGTYEFSGIMADVNSTTLQQTYLPQNPFTFASKSVYTITANIYTDTLNRSLLVHVFKHQ